MGIIVICTQAAVKVHFGGSFVRSTPTHPPHSFCIPLCVSDALIQLYGYGVQALQNI